MNKFVFWLEKYLGAFLVWSLGKTLRFKILKNPPNEKAIYAFWHRNIIPLAYLHRRQNVGIMISSSKDGELIAGPVKVLGYIPIRGSSTRKGSTALKKMVQLSKTNDLAITPDGPKGPKEKIKKGLLYLAYFSKSPIIPTAVDIDREKVFKSWDSFRLPKIRAKIFVSYGNPIWINSKEEIESKFDEVQKAMEELTKINNKRGEK